MKKLVLIDGSALAYRAYFAFIKNPLRTSRGENTSAVFGFTNSILKILKENDPSHVAVCFDTPEPTFRHRAFAPYKATREKMPEEMSEQLPFIRAVIEALGIQIIEVEGWEADDVMATLAGRAEPEGMEVVLVSEDKDLLQLVDRQVKVLHPGRRGERDVLYDTAKVQKKFGVPPERVADLLGLEGDTSDNVPGVPGIGRKTAAELISKYGGIEGALDNLERIPRNRVKESLRAFSEQALLSKDLATVRRDVPIELTLRSIARRSPDRAKLAELFQRLEFFSLLGEIAEQVPPPARYRALSKEKLKEVCEKSKGLTEVGLFLLTESDKATSPPVGLGISTRKGEAFFLILSGDSSPLRRLRPLFENEAIAKVGANLKGLLTSLRRVEIELKGELFDAEVAPYLLRPTRKDQSLESISLEYLHYPLLSLKEKGKKTVKPSSLPPDRLKDILCQRAEAALRLRAILTEELEDKGLSDLFLGLEMPLLKVLSVMEECGVLIDPSFLSDVSGRMDSDLKQIEREIYQMADREFNLRSPKQLREVLFDKLKLPTSKRTKTGYSTDASVLEELAQEHELPRKILEYRELFKLKSTYVDAIPRLADTETRRVHTSFHQTKTATGRLSSSDPNLQNIPMRTELGREIRKGFIAEEGWSILSADYSQIELRILAHLSEDENLTGAFESGDDIHSRTASLLFGIPPSKVSEENRRMAKTVNFGIVYGMSPFGLSSRLSIPLSDAEEFIALYFLTYPKVKAWIDEIVEKAREDGYVTTLLKRRRYIPELSSKSLSEREFGERVAINTPIQGTAADLIKIAMVEIFREFEKERLDTRMIIQVHDELVFEVPEGEIDQASKLVRNKMESAISLSVPIVVNIGVGKNWYEAH